MKYKEDNANRKEEEIKGSRKKNAFDNSRIANLSDDMVGVLGWKGTGIYLVIVIVLGFIVYKIFFD